MMDGADAGAKDAGTKPGAPDDTALLALVRAQMRQAVGLENDPELCDDRTRALSYLKGDMKKDIPSLPNRSKAVSSDIADAVETILPDLMEIFTGGGDVVAFVPTGPQDEAQARQESEYLSHVVWQDNPGFLNFATAIKDALLLKLGVFKFWWDRDAKVSTESFTAKNAVEVQLAAQDGAIVDLVRDNETDGAAQPTYSFTLRRTQDLSRARYEAFAPEDFAVAPDTVRIADAAYCVLRARPRIQDLIAGGIDPADARALERVTADDGAVQRARDQAGEHLNAAGDDSGEGDLAQVETREHYIRLLGEDGALHIWCVLTDAGATRLLGKDGKTRWEEPRIPFAIGTPYLVAHRLYGESLADKLFEVQRIKTALTRIMLDSGYFAQNQRYEVAMGSGRANDYTISDLLNNVPGAPIRSQDGASVRPLPAASVPFDGYAALEYFSTVAEQRSGVVRNAQGLNPDTLHDTAAGAAALMTAAQKRLRMIARVLAETCIKELYLGLHAVIRENGAARSIARLNGVWVPVDPSAWAERTMMRIEVGLGAAGRQQDLMTAAQLQAMMQQIVAGQGGAHGPIVSADNIYALATYTAGKLGVKNPQVFFQDPAAVPPAPAKPDPEVLKVQGEQALAQQKAQNEKDIALAKAQAAAATDQGRNQLEHAREMQAAANRYALAQLELQTRERIAVRVAAINAQGKIGAAQVAADGHEPPATA